MLYKEIAITTHASPDKTMGALSFFESNKDISFDIRRVYYISGVKEGVRRGHHAHKALWQLLFCPCGSIRVNMENGKDNLSVVLDDPSKGLIVGPGVWHTMDWLQDDSILCVAASDVYDESDYMRDYADYLSYLEEHPELR